MTTATKQEIFKEKLREYLVADRAGKGQCIEKVQILSRKVRRYDTAQTAYQRALAHPNIDPEVKEKLHQKYATLNPVILKQKCDTIIKKLFKIPTRLR